VTWIVLIDEDDPLYDERVDVLRSAGFPLELRPPGSLERVDSQRDRPFGPWCDYLDFSESVLTTRIDDDDAFAPWALQRVRHLADAWDARFQNRRGRRRLWVLADGYRVKDGKANPRHDTRNQFATMYAPRNDRASVMDMNHTSSHRLGQVIAVRSEPAWIWLRHDEARSNGSGATNSRPESLMPITDEMRNAFDIDWSLV
jgi:hypothetical protein